MAPRRLNVGQRDAAPDGREDGKEHGWQHTSSDSFLVMGFFFVFAAMSLYRLMLELYFSLNFHKFNYESPKYVVHLSDCALLGINFVQKNSSLNFGV
jgi:hypothetical protein